VTATDLEPLPPAVPGTAGGGPPGQPWSHRLRIPLLIGRRLIGACFSLMAVLIFNFFLFNVLSSNPVRAMARDRHLDAAAQANLRHEWGLDKPLINQFVDYLHLLFVQHSLGTSTSLGQRPVVEIISAAIWPTVLLVGTSTILSSVLGTWLGIVGAWRRGSAFDKITNGTAITFYAMPEFWLGIVLLMFLAGNQVGLGIFPISGIADDNVNTSTPSGWINVIWHLTLPCAALTFGYLAQYSVVMRSSMLDEMGQDYVLTARAKGLRDLKIRGRHVVPNALLPAVTQILLYFGFVLTGALTVEYVYSWPGLGLLTERAIQAVDYPLLRGLFLIFTASVIIFNLIADIMLGVLDPRVREL
jgi:peptide/nickel transport system permease protein